MIKIERKKIEIEIDDVVYSLVKPSIEQANQYQTSIDAVKCNPSEVLKIVSEYFISLGIPKQVTESLDMDMFSEIASLITGSKKN